MELHEALKQLRTLEKKKFDQSIDLIINLKGIDIKRDNIATIARLPHSLGAKRVCGFLTKKSDQVTSIMQPDFARYKDKKDLKNLVKNYDFFIAAAPLMPSVATTFGKVLGPAGKMPSPQLGVLMQETESAIKETLDKISHAVKIRVKEPSVKVVIGKESMKDEQLIENITAVYESLVNALPTKKENVKNILIKLTMSKPLKVELK